MSTILIANPSQKLADLNLQDYMILDCEPLYDLKGHLLNLLTELPHILDKPAKAACEKHILFSKRENGFSGSDL